MEQEATESQSVYTVSSGTYKYSQDEPWSGTATPTNQNPNTEHLQNQSQNYLGDLTNEIDVDEGNHIVEGVFPGPKNYAYRTDFGKTTCKVKGFSLNYTAEQNVNFESMKQMILKEMHSIDDKIKINVEQSVITRDRKTWTICSGIISKVYSHVYDKRILNNDFTTLPYGYLLN